LKTINISFGDNKLLSQLFGEADKNLSKIEKTLGVELFSRGNKVSIKGDEREIHISEAILRSIYEKLQKGSEVSDTEIDATIRMLSDSTDDYINSLNGGEKVKENTKPSNDEITSSVVIKTMKKDITPYTRMQGEYMRNLLEKELVFAAGPAGTGKTYLAVSAAVSMFVKGEVDRIILSRPAVEAGENLGFLPGDMREKVDPYLRPLYDALYDMLPAEKVVKYMETGEIEIAPLAFMRGRTLRNAYVILDEAQNATPVQMKMFLTRLGEGTRMAVTGDLSQTDLPKGQRSGFRDALEKLEDINEVSVTRFTDKDSVRHPLTVKIIQAYEKDESEDKWKKNG